VQTRALLVALPLLLVVVAPAHAAGDPRVAALQVALRARGWYAGTVDGVAGPATAKAVRRLQRRAGLAADGVAGARTLRVLRRHELGSRMLRRGVAGFDVAELQFELAWHGFPSGSFDGGFGARTEGALRRFQRWARLTPDGRAGPATFAALRGPVPRCPITLASPLHAPLGDRYGPRGIRFHSGIDLRAPTGAGVIAAGPGRVTWAGWLGGGWGLLVVVAHPRNVRTMYAHLSRIEVRLGQRVQAGWELGRVGATGDATGPHLHFEVRVRDAAVDPLPALR
jgi:murein DD-endopeptidase MepM/ murein hydrolase activator NlpD